MWNEGRPGWWLGHGRGRGRGWHPRPPGDHPFGEPPGRLPPRRVREMFDERPLRADRGVVRYLVLDAIRETPRHGYEIMAAIETKSRQSYRPSPGVIYPTLQLLEELEHVRVTVRDDKKVYAITAAGTRDLDEHRDDIASFYEQAEDGFEDHGSELIELAHLVRRLLRTFRRSARRGRLTAAKMAKVRTLLEDTARKLEDLLDER